MNKNFPRALYLRVIITLAIVLLGCGSISAQFQTRDKYLISAKAGKINSRSGKLSIQRRGSLDWQPSSRAIDDLDSGDVLRTEADGRAELLLNPGSYLRVAENTDIEFTDVSLDNLQFKVLRGSAIVEATGTDGTRLLAQINTPQTKILIDRNGLYRVNVSPATATEVLVYKGRASVGSANVIIVKSGSKIVIENKDPSAGEIAKFDKKNQDSFSSWSKQRASALAAANRSLTGRTVTSVLASFRNNGAFGYGYAPYFGLWVFDTSLSGYTFLPFYARWSSPYGLGYQNNFGIPWYFYRPSAPGEFSPVTNPGGSNGGNGGVSNPTPPVASSPGIIQHPPHKMREPDDPIGDRPVRPMPVDRINSAGRFDREFGGSRRSDSFESGISDPGSRAPERAPIQREHPEEIYRPSAPAEYSRPERPGRKGEPETP
jgi:hypothetical protein